MISSQCRFPRVLLESQAVVRAIEKKAFTIISVYIYYIVEQKESVISLRDFAKSGIHGRGVVQISWFGLKFTCAYSDPDCKQINDYESLASALDICCALGVVHVCVLDDPELCSVGIYLP